MINVRFDTSNNSIIVIIDTLYTIAETRLIAHSASIFTTTIEQITEIKAVAYRLPGADPLSPPI